MACLKSSCLSQWMSRRRPEGGLLQQAQNAPYSSSPNKPFFYYDRWAFKRNTSSPGLCKHCRKLNFTKILKLKRRPYMGRPPHESLWREICVLDWLRSGEGCLLCDVFSQEIPDLPGVSAVDDEPVLLTCKATTLFSISGEVKPA